MPPADPRASSASSGKAGSKKRVLILGAGPAGLATAFGLSNSEELRDRYDVHVYQVGWRAGGKITSGRFGQENRVEQNGTHYLFGCYENSFRVIREAYRELEEKGNTRFGRYEDAFHPVSLLALKHFFNGEWTTWILEIPTNRKPPGTGNPILNFVDVASASLQWMIELVAGWRTLIALQPTPPFAPGQEPTWWRRLVGPFERSLEDAVNWSVAELLQLALRLVRRLAGEQGEREIREALRWVLRRTRSLLEDALGARAEHDLEACRAWMLMDIGLTTLIGVIEDDVFAPGGMAAIDPYDFREWLERHGASDLGIWSPLVTAWYDSIASYELGDADKPRVSAGATVNALYRSTLTYKGAFAYQAARELGDSFVAPLYAALEERGVHFHFFQRVRDLLPEGDQIQTIVVERQAEMAEDGIGIEAYEPFTEVRGLAAWPSGPRVDQLNWSFDQPHGQGPVRDPYVGVDLEDFYTDFEGCRYELERGRDFDEVVYAMPVEAMSAYAREILSVQPSWRRMVEKVEAVDTQSLWLYFRPTLEELGWEAPPPILTSFAKPFSTWEATSYLLATETWPPGEVPGTISSLFGPLHGPRFAPPAEDPGSYPADQKRAAEASAWRFATELAGSLWPRSTGRKNPLELDWELLIDLEHREGRARFDFQPKQANYGPIQRYTLALPGSLDARPRADESSYRNLTFAGDWTRNGAIIGSVEGAVASGLLAAIAISGEGHVIGYDPDNGLA